MADIPLQTSSVASNEVRIFISYSHLDADIAQVFYDILKERNKSRVFCFMDSFSITSGDNWHEKICSELEMADWLIFIYRLGRPYEYCGYEIGMFSIIKQLKTDDAIRSSRRMFCIHDSDSGAVPAMLRFTQNRKVEYSVTDVDTTLERKLTLEEQRFYQGAPIGRFLTYFQQQEPAGNPLVQFDPQRLVEDQVAFAEKVATQARKLTMEFRKAYLAEVKPIERILQPRVDIKTLAAELTEGRLSRNAEISGKDETFRILGFSGMPDESGIVRTTWGNLRNCSPPRNLSARPR